MYGRENNGDLISESWEVSVHPDGISEPLADYLAQNPTAVDQNGSAFPVLIKYIDAAQNLSVQVHPNDAYAQRVEGDNGKTEMWYILDAEEGAGIYCGFQRDTTKEEFLAKVQNGTVEELLNFIPVKKGDCYLIEAGTVHAIGAGCVICEVQQSSNVTYRVYDYNRRGADGKLRPLHIEKAVEVINFRKFEDHTNTGKCVSVSGGNMQLLTQCEYFCCRKLDLNGVYEELNAKSYVAVNVLAGSGKISGKTFTAGDSFFIPCGEGFTISGKAEIILTTKKNVQKYFGAIDLGGTFIKCGIVDEYGNVVCKEKVATNGAYSDVSKAMAETVLKLAEQAGVTLSAIGIGAPGTIDSEHGIIVYSNNLCWENVPLAKDVSRRTDVPVFITNDANAAALGEYAYGAGQSYKSMIMITLGTGVGSGIVFDGKLFEGNKSAGAELGHTVIKLNGEKCTCGQKGCLEAYASASALVRQTQSYMLAHSDTVMWQLAERDLLKVNGKTVFDGIRVGDIGAKRVLKKYIDYLACGLTSIANAFRPEVIVLGGGISAEGELLTKPLQAKLSRRVFGGNKYAPVKIVTAELKNDAGLLGAAKLAMSGIQG